MTKTIEDLKKIRDLAQQLKKLYKHMTNEQAVAEATKRYENASKNEAERRD